MESVLVIPDTHRPWHHVKAYNLMLKVAIDLKPSRIIILGDYADFYGINGHGPKNPAILTSLQEEIISVNFGLDELDQLFPEAKKVFICGNHEDRLQRFITNRCPELFGLTSCFHLFEMPRRNNWEWIEYLPNQKYQLGQTGLYIRHKPLKSGAMATIREAGTSVIWGHTHRREMIMKKTLDGRDLIGACPGWLGNSKSKVVDYVDFHQWQNGFMIVYVDGKEFHIESPLIIGNSTLAMGRIFKS